MRITSTRNIPSAACDYHGKGVEQDHRQAFHLYTQAANQSFPYASFELGKMLRDGIGCEKIRNILTANLRKPFVASLIWSRKAVTVSSSIALAGCF